MNENSGHLNTYVYIPLVGEFCFEWGGITRGRWFVDALSNEGGFEIWFGKAHVIADPSKSLKSALFGLALLVANLLPSVLDVTSVYETSAVPAVSLFVEVPIF